ncbi:hypothetical protein HS99_0024675 [Kitasatospora aureofaciens]|uniref:Uncharacterized protein n=1 Tax=Kitasatospora aureofaciens TaxID=1894 RepID=A0A1E7NAS4_KITAU|nr:hypothetical protein B6264_03325 [Kitasatospora aureofaciens]OEV37789.1 hypothetical protein HS99_0024675 [Kitasatospora aureofaciens]
MPLSVWLTEPLAGCCPTCENPTGAACAQRIPPGLARQITEAFSARGDLVFIPDAGNAAVLAAAVQAGRRVLALASSHQSAHLAYDTLHITAPTVASLAVLRRGTPGHPSGRADSQQGRARLAIAAPHDSATPVQLTALAETCTRALRPDGVLVICTRQTSGQETAGHVVAHARASGLVYLQHIAAVEATAGDAGLVPRAPVRTQHHPGCACHHPRPGSGRHALIHSDLLVFTKP